MKQISLFGIEDADEDKAYTRTIETPIYRPTGPKPHILDLVDKTRYTYLCRQINKSGLGDAERQFLLDAAARHFGFNYAKIANYYAQSSEEMQHHMEQSALVIIDFERAIELGFVRLQDGLVALQKTEPRYAR